jgi:hypothetical protein
MGGLILGRQQAKWGGNLIEKLLADLRAGFLDVNGQSRRNLLYMRA